MRFKMITMDHALSMEYLIFQYDNNVRHVNTIDDLIDWHYNFKKLLENKLQALGAKRDDIVEQYLAIGSAVAYNLTTIPYNKEFLDIFAEKDEKEIVHLISLGNSLRYFARLSDQQQFIETINVFNYQGGKLIRYEDFYDDV